MVYAVDFDGTLCENAFPEIGAPRVAVINFVKAVKAAGDKVILWTCRVDARLDAALAWCAKQGITFDAVNDNLPEFIKNYGTNCRKVCADAYIDDRAWDADPYELDMIQQLRYSDKAK